MEATQTLARGSLAWSGDLDLLERYGVTTHEIADRLTEIFTNFGSLMGRRLINAEEGVITSHTFFFPIEDHLEVKADVFFQRIQKVQCAYCNQLQENNIDYTIKNTKTNEAILVPNILLHLVREHSDLGDPGKYRLNPTQICKVLELGDTSIEIQKDDPLFEIVKFGNWHKNQIEQKKADDEMLAKLQLTSADVAARLTEIVEKGEAQLTAIKVRSNHNYQKKIVLDERFEICWDRCLGYQHCNLCTPPQEFEGFGEGSITNVHSEKSMKVSTLFLHSLSEHGYFGINPEYRVDPKHAVELLEVGK